jgi:DNA primase
MIDKDYLLEAITEDQILDLLKEFGAIPYGAIKENEIWFNTICHGGDSHKLCYFRNSKTFYCYTNCGKMSLFTLVMKVRDCNFSESVNFIARHLGISNRYGFNVKLPRINQELNQIDRYISLRKSKIKNQIKNLPRINEKILDYFETDVFYQGWIDEGISIETMQLFNIRWYESQKHIIIPHYNVNGELIGIRRRSLQEKDKDNKYMPEIIEGIQYTHSLNFNLYGLDKHINGIKKTKKVVIVESEKSVMLAHDYYGKDAFVIATCGFNISNWQRDMILSLGVEEVMLGYDKDFIPTDFEDVSDNDPEYKKYIRYVKPCSFS